MIDYSTTWDGGVKGGIRIIGEGTARRYARSIASYMISAARCAPENEPVQFVTGNSFMPPLRSFSDADRVWHAGNGYASADEDADVRVWQALTDELERLLDEARVYLDSPDYDNCLYVVDLARFAYAETQEEPDDLNGDWRLTA
jgi:hypothetical protein